MPALDEHLPLKAIDFHILLVLTDRGPLHGYGMVREIEERSEGRIRLEPGNLYRYIRRLVDEGLVEGAEPRRVVGSDRRRDYRVTPLGRRVLAADVGRMRGLIRAAEAGLAEAGVGELTVAEARPARSGVAPRADR